MQKLTTKKPTMTKSRLTQSFFKLALIPFSLAFSAYADDQLAIEEMGFVSHQIAEQANFKLPVATTVIRRIGETTTETLVSQSFDNTSEQTIRGEYHFPVPDSTEITKFEIRNDYQSEQELPSESVTIAKGEQLTIQYQLTEINDQHLALMGFPKVLTPQSNELVSEAQVATK